MGNEGSDPDQSIGDLSGPVKPRWQVIDGVARECQPQGGESLERRRKQFVEGPEVVRRGRQWHAGALGHRSVAHSPEALLQGKLTGGLDDLSPLRLTSLRGLACCPVRRPAHAGPPPLVSCSPTTPAMISTRESSFKV